MPRSKTVSLENRDKYIAIGLNIAYYRKRDGMTQEQFADRAGLSRTYLGEIEAPNMITPVSLETIFNIATALQIPVSKLFEFRE